jgi:toxin ParE1/3/4
VRESPARKVYLHPGAEAELVEAVRYYEGEEQGLGARFEAEIARCAQLIRRAPEAALLVRPKGVRRKLLQRFPYSLVYAIEPDRIRILAVMHHKRRPGYWGRRR